MLKNRVIPVLLMKDNFCVKPRCFEHPGRNVGVMSQYIKNMNSRNIDELILLDIDTVIPNFTKISDLLKHLFCPVTVGGGVATLNDIENLLRFGADKVCIGSNNINFKFIEEAAKKFGSQAIVISIDFKTISKKLVRSWTNLEYTFIYNVYIQKGKIYANIDAVTLAKKVADHGAGEIILTDIERDGTRMGYNLKAVSEVSKAVSIPVIANGGCEGFNDMAKAFDNGANAVAASTIFLFTAVTPNNCSEYLNIHGYKTRVET